MRLSSLFIAFSTFALLSCTKAGGPTPEDVLSKTSLANSGLRSARLQIQAGVSTVAGTQNPINGSAQVMGNIQQGGQQLDLLYETNGNIDFQPEHYSWKSSGRLIVVSQNESYVLVKELETTLPVPLLGDSDAKNVLNTWFRLPPSGSSSTSLTPDPRFLRLQTEVVRVQKDHGIEKIDGKKAYHYTVSIDQNRLASFMLSATGTGSVQGKNDLMKQLGNYEATGELWIDAETFLLTKAAWTIKNTQQPDITITVSMTISDVGVPVVVTAPNESKPFPNSVLPTSRNATILQTF